MTTPAQADSETRFNRSAWLTLAFAALLFVYSIALIAYRFTLPTDGWRTNEATEVGFNYTENLMGFPSGLQPGDNVVAVEGNPANWDAISPSLREAWQAGATLEYTVVRDGREMQVPVTLGHWQLGKLLQGLLRDPSGLVSQLTPFLLLFLGSFVFLRRPGNPTAGSFFFLLFLLTIMTFEPIPSGWPEWIDPVSRISKIIQDTLLIIIFPYVIIRFALFFPHPKPILQRRPWLAYIPLAVGVFISFLGTRSPLSWFWFVLSFVVTVIILIHNAITMRDAASRAQLLWGLGGVIFGFGVIASIFLINTFGIIPFNDTINNRIFAVALLIMGICLAIAITRYHLFDINIIIRKTLVYGTLTAVLVLVYFGAVTLSQNLFVALTGEQSPVAIVLSTLAIAALFTPLRRRIQNTIDRRFYRRNYDAEKTLQDFALRAREETDLDSLTDELLLVVEETLQPKNISLWIKPMSVQDPKSAGKYSQQSKTARPLARTNP
jgi:hypothetical protein